jgi:hypothetical protein
VTGKRSHDYIDGFADLVVPNDPDAFRQRLLATVVASFEARHVALFSVDAGRLRLAASSAIDQGTLDRADSIWRHRFAGSDVRKPIVEPARSGQLGVVAIPVAAPEGLLYVEAEKSPGEGEPGALQRLADLAAIALREAWSGPVRARATGYLRQATEEDLLRDKLLLSLQEHEWNIARVARLLGVTRRTIYLRLERWSIERRKVAKTVRREA